MRRSAVLVSLVFVGCQFQASCGGKTINTENARAFVAKALADDGAPPDRVVCPDGVALKKDTTFECTAHYGTATATVAIVQNDDEGNVTISGVSGILVSKRAEEQIAKMIGEKSGVYVTVDCGPRVRAATAGESFTCGAKGPNGEQSTVKVTVKDAAGNVSFAVVNPTDGSK